MANFLVGVEFLFCKVKSSGVWLHHTVNMINTTDCILRNGKDGKYVMCVLPQFKKTG